MLCATCNSELDNIPAGVSKRTGQAYTAFSVCPNKCGQPPQGGSRHQDGAVTPLPPQSNAVPQSQPGSPDWGKINALKEESMNWLNAKRGAVELVAALLATKTISPDKTNSTITDYANWLYDLKPVMKQEVMNQGMRAWSPDVS